MSFNKLLLLICLFTFLLAGCDISDNGPEQSIDISKFNTENFPRVDGSTSTRPLMRIIACEIFDLKYIWVDTFDGTKDVYSNEDDPAKAGKAEFVNRLWFSKTPNAYNRLITDSTDIILVAREPSPDELAAANEAGVKFKIAPIALDGLVFIVNSVNPVFNLSSNQVLNVYTGLTTNWDLLGGLNASINPYIRNRNSGSQELMDKLVLKGHTSINVPDMMIPSMMGLINIIDTDTNGIGYTVYFYNSTMVQGARTKMISINGIFPDKQSLRNRKYLYTEPVYAVIRENTDVNSNTFLFFKWLQTYEGQQAVAKSGYVKYSH